MDVDTLSVYLGALIAEVVSQFGSRLWVASGRNLDERGRLGVPVEAVTHEVAATPVFERVQVLRDGMSCDSFWSV